MTHIVRFENRQTAVPQELDTPVIPAMLFLLLSEGCSSD